MTGNEFLRRITVSVGRAALLSVSTGATGKGSHGTVHYGSHKATLKDLRKEIGTGLLHDMLAQLGLSLHDLDE
jgi:mRNA interferase HicA